MKTLTSGDYGRSRCPPVWPTTSMSLLPSTALVCPSFKAPKAHCISTSRPSTSARFCRTPSGVAELPFSPARTVPQNLPERVGLAADSFDALDVGSPFDYAANSLLYCPSGFPNPNGGAFQSSVNDELFRLITAARGRTLALFTSYRAMDAAVEALRPILDVPVISQRDQSQKSRLVDAFIADESACLFATAGFFQGIDIPGRTLSLVTIDRIPFPRPDDPLLSARRDLVGDRAFRDIDLPRAATLLAQAAGRLIRSTTDRGVVAVFDPRLATAGYRRHLLAAMPPMKRTIDRQEVMDFLRSIDE